MNEFQKHLLGAEYLGYSISSRDLMEITPEANKKITVKRHFLQTSPSSPIGLRSDLVKFSPFPQNLFGYVRTTSWDFDNDRSDLHDLISCIVGITLRHYNISTSLLTVTHEDLGLTKMPAEIYARLLSFERHRLSHFEESDIPSDAIQQVFLGTYFAAFLMDNVFSYTSSHYPIWEQFEDRANKIARFLDKRVISGKQNFMCRKNPDWFWFRSFKSGISIFSFDESTLNNFKAAFEQELSTMQFQGVTRDIIKFNKMGHAICPKKLDRGYATLEFLKDSNYQKPKIIPIENKFFLIGKNHILAIDDECGEESYRKELQQIKLRNDEERRFLFPSPNFVWSVPTNPDRFEKLCKELLQQESHVTRIKRVSSINEGDGGKDLIAEWLFLNPSPNSADSSPYILKNILVQCKAYKNSVGKDRVQDIRDTIDMNNADGYHLIVSSQLTTQLFDYLSILRKRGIQIDWWTRDDLEDRLRKHPDVVDRFLDIVKPT